MKRQHPLRIFYREYKNIIIYGLIGINIFGMIVAVRVFINYRSIQASIAKVEAQKEILLEQDWYAKNFQIHYLNSEYAPYFLAHENNGILPGEKMIKIGTKFGSTSNGQTNTEGAESQSRNSEEKTPQDARKEFLQDLLEKNSF